MRYLTCALFLLAGCGQPAVPSRPAPAETAPPAPGTPAAIVIERLPLIDACLALSPATRTITIDSGASSMVLSGADQNVECVFVGAASPESAAIVPALDHGPVENPIIFVRAPGENPGGECYEAPEVHAADGGLLGWLLDPEGC